MVLGIVLTIVISASVAISWLDRHESDYTNEDIMRDILNNEKATHHHE